MDGMKMLRLKATFGDSASQFLLGGIYYNLFANGPVVAKNYHEAMKWFRKAAENGISEAQYYLGYGYFKGYGVEQNSFEAVK